MKCLFGSHLYQLQTPSSDKDYKGIYLPEKDNLLLGNYAKHYSQSTGDDKSKNTAYDIDVEIFSLPYFIELACKGETVAIDMLHADNRLPELTSDVKPLWCIWHQIQMQRTKFYTKDMKSYVGYARKQANKYGIRGSRMGAVEDALKVVKALSPELRLKEVWDLLPTGEHILKVVMSDKSQSKPLNFYEVCGRKYQDTLLIAQLEAHLEGIYNEYGERAKQAKDNLGCDWKAISHALRASYQMLGILKDGDFEYPLPQTEFLLAVKTGQLNFVNEVQPELESVIQTIEKLAESSSLPSKVDRAYWDKWLLEVYNDYL